MLCTSGILFSLLIETIDDFTFSHMGGAKHDLCKINGTACLKQQLKLCLSDKLTIVLCANFASNVVCSKDWLFQFHLQRKFAFYINANIWYVSIFLFCTRAKRNPKSFQENPKKFLEFIIAYWNVFQHILKFLSVCKNTWFALEMLYFVAGKERSELKLTSVKQINGKLNDCKGSLEVFAL